MTTAMALGWAGATMQLAGYALLVTGRLANEHPMLHVLNVVGSVGIVAMAVTLAAWPTVVLNLAWMATAMVAMARIRARRMEGDNR